MVKKFLVVIIVLLIFGTYSLNSKKTSSLNDQQLATFEDNYFGVKFNYQKSLKLHYLIADQKDPTSIIFVSESPDSESNAKIAINCKKDNRIQAFGMCYESIVSDVDIYIDKVGKLNLWTPSNNKDCIKKEEKEKTIYSCVLRGLAPGSSYYREVVFLNSKNLKMTLDTNTKRGNQQTLDTIINSLE